MFSKVCQSVLAGMEKIKTDLENYYIVWAKFEI